MEYFCFLFYFSFSRIAAKHQWNPNWMLCNCIWNRILTNISIDRALVEFKDEPTKSAQSIVPTNFESAEKLVLANGEITGENSVDRIKSAISVVQEIAQKRDLPIRFVVESETGPAHMKHFVIKCSVGDIEVSVSACSISDWGNGVQHSLGKSKSNSKYHYQMKNCFFYPCRRLVMEIQKK